MEYEDTLIREQTEGPVHWCSQCERDAEDCICEEISDHFRQVCSDNSGADVREFPAASEHLHERGAEAEPYTNEEAEARRQEWILQ